MDRQTLADKLDMKHWDSEVIADAALRRIAELEAALEKIAEGCAEPKTRRFAREALSR